MNIDISLFSNRKFIYVFMIVFSFVLYGNTIAHQYALDDAIVITENDYVQKGIDGIPEILTNDVFTGFFGVKKNLVEGGRYRPLSLITFAIEHEFFGETPFISHIINILLYALTGILLFLLLQMLFFDRKLDERFAVLPFVISLIWMAHPLHTEVVANIKGRDEILSLLFAFSTFIIIVKYVSNPSVLKLIVANAVFFLGLISKEMTITFLLIIPLGLFFFTSFSFKKMLIPSFSLFTPTIIFLLLRQSIMLEPAITGVSIPQELMNNSFLGTTVAEKYATIIYTLLVYIKLLFIPYPLTFDYYPYHIAITNFSNIWVVISLLVHVALAIIAVVGIKKKRFIAFGILYYVITFSIVSNLFFSIGTFMSERFMYMPSVGWAMVIGYLLHRLLEKLKWGNYMPFIILIFAFPFVIISINRNEAWKNDYVLFTTDVKTSTQGAKSNTSAGGKIMEECEKLDKIVKSKPQSIREIKRQLEETLLRKQDIDLMLISQNKQQIFKDIQKYRKEQLLLAKRYLKKAIEIHPSYVDAFLLLGNAHYLYNKDMDSIWFAYESILKQNPKHPLVSKNWTQILNDSIPYQKKIMYHQKLLDYNPNLFENCYQIGHIYGRYLGQIDSAIVYLERAKFQNPKSHKVYKDLGVAYGMSKQFDKALETMLMARKINPKDPQILINIGVTYQMLGKFEKATEYFSQAEALK